MEFIIVIALGYALWKGVRFLWWPMLSGQAYDSSKLTSPSPIVISKSDENVELKNQVHQQVSTVKRLLMPYEKLDALERRTYADALTDIEEYVLDCMTRRCELTELVDYIRVRSIQSELQRYRVLDANRYRSKIEVLQERIDIREDADRRIQKVTSMIDDALTHLDKVITSLTAMKTNMGSDDHFKSTIEDLEHLIFLSGKLNAYSLGEEGLDELAPITLTNRAVVA